MYTYNTDTKKWVRETDTLNQDDYDNLKQDLQLLQLYSRALSGATYLHTSNTASIYESLKYKDDSTWFVASSPYNPLYSLPTDGTPITNDTLSTYQKYSEEYGFTLRNFFTPMKTIDSLNIINVSVATTNQINLTTGTFSQIDGINLIEGNLVLVKDQLSTVDLAFSLDPETYFDVNYYFISTNIADITYQYYNEENGIYKFSEGRLIKQDISTYSLSSGLSVYVDLGDTYQDKQFSLSRKKAGYFPVEGEPFEFRESKNYLVRNQVDYHNLYESNYYDVLKHEQQSLVIEDYIYTIPQRLLYIGEFGIILNLQSLTYSQYVYNPYKETLRNITQTYAYYWLCGDNGTILRMSKLDFSITKVDLGQEWRQLMSISFIDDLNGIVVGKNNCIYYTKDGGYNWSKLEIGEENYSYNRCLYHTYNLIFLAGENGLFGRLNYSDSSGFNFQKVNLPKNLSLTDQYDLIQDINDMYYANFKNWGLTYATAVDLTAGNGINSDMECLFMVTNNSNILCYEINNFVTEHGVLYLSFSQSFGDFTSITRQQGTDNLVISGDSIIKFDINTFKYVSTTSNVVNGSSYSLLLDKYNNSIFDYKGEELYIVGNFASIYEYNYDTQAYNSLTTEPIIPKMLFMEYDMADKLNFFDSNYDYRLPNSVSFSSTDLNYLNFAVSQNTWLDYLRDTWKVYPAVGSDTSTGNQVQPNLLFTKRDNSSITFNSSDITLSYNDISSLYPNVGSKTASRWKSFTPIIPSLPYSVWMNGYMSIFKLPYDFCSPGDILRISSNNIEANLMVNYGLTTSSTPGGVILSSTISSGGTGYNINNLFTINSGTTLAIGKVTAITGSGENAGGEIKNYTSIVTSGTNYTLGQTFSFIGGDNKAVGIITGVTAISGLVSIVIAGSTTSFGYVNGPSYSAKFAGGGGKKIQWINNKIYISDTANYTIRKFDFATNLVSTVAGNGTFGFSGDGGLATSATFRQPEGFIVDNSGNIFIADLAANNIRRVNGTTGIINTIVNSANGPKDICLDSFGNIYFTEINGNRIRKINTFGTVSLFCGTGISGFSGDGASASSARINKPSWIASDNLNNIYFWDSLNYRIRKVDNSGTITTVAGNGTYYVGTPNISLVANSQPFGLVDGLFIDHITNLMYITYATSSQKWLVTIDLSTLSVSYKTFVAFASSVGGVSLDTSGTIYYFNSYAIFNLLNTVITPGLVTNLIISASGSLYTNGSVVSTSASSGSGLTVRIVAESIYSLPSGIVTSYDILSTGIGYSNGIKATTLVSGSASASGLTINLLTTSPLSISNTYFYAFNDFNTAILNSIKSSPTLTITNLNKFENASVLASNFENHPIAEGYKLTYDNSSNLMLEPKFNNYTAYKSLETSIAVVNGSTSSILGLNYANTFNLFGYTPKYSLLSYLSNINSTFTANKIFYTMPTYIGLPCNAAGNFTTSNIYYDANKPMVGTMSFPKNKLIFGSDLKFEFDTLWINTFVDLNLYTSGGNFTKTRTLITDKYYDEVYKGFVLEFDDNIVKTDDGITHYGVALNSIDIIARNTLGQISNDLEIFNNLNKPLITKKYNSGLWMMNIYDNPIKTKINTDSYTKILLSDRDIKKYVNSIIYTNSDNILSLNLLNLPTKQEIQINDSFPIDSNLGINTSSLKDLDGTFIGYLNFKGGTGSSQELNPEYNGINSITKIANYDALVNRPFLNFTTTADIGTLTVYKYDPFFNYSPVNLLEVADNKMFKIPTVLTPQNLDFNGATYSLVGNITTPSFRLVDGLDIDTIQREYHWILEAEITDAIIGLDLNGIVWYKGIWHTGRWFGGTWHSGTWISGDWYSGTWYSNQIVDNFTSVTVAKTSYDNYQSLWYDGRWFDGSWKAGSWLNGRWYNGTWSSGLWFNGVWNDGVWNDGVFSGGVWIRGTWISGLFNSFNKPSYWLDGSFVSGNFENGMWYNGVFGLSNSVINKFGSSASNSRNAIWQGGVWSSGNFYSNEYIVGGTVSTSPIHKYSQWRTGTFNSGNFYGGIVYNIDFNGGIWHSGIILDIQIIGVNLSTNVLTLNGLFRFNIGDYVNIIEDGTYTPYLNLGNYDNAGRYRVALVEYDYEKNWTFITLNYNLSSLGVTGTYSATASYNVDTGIRLVSKLKNVDWYKGIWYNGIFEGGTFYGGMWYNGIFNGTWGI